MPGDGGGRYDDDDKIIDITDYVSKKSDSELEIDEFTSTFVDIFNQNIIAHQREVARKRFVHFMINFLLFTQIAIVIVLCFIFTKIY